MAVLVFLARAAGAGRVAGDVLPLRPPLDGAAHRRPRVERVAGLQPLRIDGEGVVAEFPRDLLDSRVVADRLGSGIELHQNNWGRSRLVSDIEPVGPDRERYFDGVNLPAGEGQY